MGSVANPRKVSLNLQNVTPQSAVDTIAAAYGLALAPINGIQMLTEGVPTDLATYRASETESFRIQNSQALTSFRACCPTFSIRM